MPSDNKTLNDILADYAVAKGITQITVNNYRTMLKRSRMGDLTMAEISAQMIDSKKAELLLIEKERGKSGIWAEKAINTVLMLQHFAYTAQRKRNVCEMRWDEIDFNSQVWRIPRTKNGTSHTLPIVEPAMAILKQRYESVNKHSVWVFPRTDGQGPIWYRCTAWKALCKEAGFENLRIHDLPRRSMRGSTSHQSAMQ